MKRYIFLGLADLALLLTAFFLVHLFNYGHLNVSETGRQILNLQILIWLPVSLVSQKFTRVTRLSLINGAGLLLKSGIGVIFVLSLVIVAMHYTHFSRTMAYGTLIVFILLEAGALALYQWLSGPVPHPGRFPIQTSPVNISRPLFFFDGVLLVMCFFLVTWLKRGSFTLTPPYDDILIILMGLWVMSALVTRKFDRNNFTDNLNAFAPALKAGFFMAFGLTFLIFLFRLEPISRFQAMGAIPFLLALELALFSLYSNFRRHGRLGADIEDADQVRSMLAREQESLAPIQEQPRKVADPVRGKLEHALVFFDPGLFTFIREHINLDQVEHCRCSLLSTDNMFNLDVMGKAGMDLIINLHKVNDMRWLNRYFLLCHEKLGTGGYLVGKAHTITTHRDYFRSRYPKYVSQLFLGASFVWKRMFPKLPWLQKFYFSLTKGRNRTVSRAEVLGRLSFCGFEIIAEKELGYRLFFIARKIKKPSIVENPTFGPLVRLNRTGLEGNPITVYKFRTMYPFSEFLQDYVYKNHSLEKGGKFKDDFRVTGWGKIFRKLWIDELPMLYNWLRGDLSLVGVRPLSSQYLGLYTPEHRELRQKIKPGLLPPFYADMPVTLEEIMESERRYIESYLARPVSTQIRYFFRCVWNIVIKRKRSA